MCAALRHIFTVETVVQPCKSSCKHADVLLHYCAKHVNGSAAAIVATPDTGHFKHDYCQDDVHAMRKLRMHRHTCSVVCFRAHYTACACRIRVVQIGIDADAYPAHVQLLRTAAAAAPAVADVPFALPTAFVLHTGHSRSSWPFVLMPGPTLKIGGMASWFERFHEASQRRTQFALHMQRSALRPRVFIEAIRNPVQGYPMTIPADSAMFHMDKRQDDGSGVHVYDVQPRFVYLPSNITKANVDLSCDMNTEAMKYSIDYRESRLVPICRMEYIVPSDNLLRIVVECSLNEIHCIYDPDACRRALDRNNSHNQILPINISVMQHMSSDQWCLMHVGIGATRDAPTVVSGILRQSNSVLNADQQTWFANWEDSMRTGYGNNVRCVSIYIPTQCLKRNSVARIRAGNWVALHDLLASINDPNPHDVPIVIRNRALEDNHHDKQWWVLTRMRYLCAISSRTVSVLAAATGMGKSFFMTAAAYAMAATKDVATCILVPPHLLFQTAQMLVDEHMRRVNSISSGAAAFPDSLGIAARTAIAAAARGDMSPQHLGIFAGNIKRREIWAVLKAALGPKVAPNIHLQPTNLSEDQWTTVVRPYLGDRYNKFKVFMIDEAHLVIKKSDNPYNKFKVPLCDILNSDSGALNIMAPDVHILLASASLEQPTYVQAAFMAHITAPQMQPACNSIMWFPKRDYSTDDPHRVFCCWNVPYIDPPRHRLSQRGVALPWVRSSGLPWHADTLALRTQGGWPHDIGPEAVGAINWLMHMNGRHAIASMFRHTAVDSGRLDAAIASAMASLPARGASFDELVAAIRANLVGGCSETAAQTMAMMSCEEEAAAMKDLPTCGICMSDMTITEALIHLRCCHAIFHKECMDTYAQVGVQNGAMSCPMCRHCLQWPKDADLLVRRDDAAAAAAEKRRRDDSTQSPAVRQIAEVLTRVRAKASKGTLIFVHMRGSVCGSSTISHAFRRRPEIRCITEAVALLPDQPACVVGVNSSSSNSGRPCVIMPYECMSGLNVQHAFDSLVVVGHPNPAGPSPGHRAQLEGRIMRQGQTTAVDCLGIGYVPVLPVD